MAAAAREAHGEGVRQCGEKKRGPGKEKGQTRKLMVQQIDWEWHRAAAISPWRHGGGLARVGEKIDDSGDSTGEYLSRLV